MSDIDEQVNRMMQMPEPPPYVSKETRLLWRTIDSIEGRLIDQEAKGINATDTRKIKNYYDLKRRLVKAFPEMPQSKISLFLRLCAAKDSVS